MCFQSTANEGIGTLRGSCAVPEAVQYSIPACVARHERWLCALVEQGLYIRVAASDLEP